MRLRRLRRYTAWAAALVLSAAGLGAVALAGAAPASAATGCSVAYSVSSQWNTGFTAAITITNLGSPLTSWSLGYSYAGNEQLAQGWSGTWSQTGQNVTVANASWNGSLATSGSVQIGANFSYSGTNTSPTAFTLNGVACTGQTTGGSPGSITVSQSSLSVVQGSTGTVGVSLSSAPSANVTVSVTSSGNSGLTALPTSLTFTPSNFSTAQNVTITADSSGTGTTTFTLSAAGYPSVTISATETSSGGGGGGSGHVADPFTGAKPYLNPDYVSEVNAQATADGSSAEAAVAKYQTAIWLDTISAIRRRRQHRAHRAPAAADQRGRGGHGVHPVPGGDRGLRPAGPGLRGAGIQRRDTGDRRRAHRVRDLPVQSSS